MRHSNLPAGSQTNSMVYAQGRQQYVVIVAAGHHFMETPKAAYVMAYALTQWRRPLAAVFRMVQVQALHGSGDPFH